mmetsp:Transcript_77460/g.155219  ORF Transcript_77460/g.155219 Transcript_77460/m.155219 type:complete len:212 (+) Transcript_77460:521-1156(+)
MVTGQARERKVLMNWSCEITVVVLAPASPPCTATMVSPVRTPEQCATPPAGASDTNTPVIVMPSGPEPNITARVDIVGAGEAGEVAAATSTTGIGAGFATAVSTESLEVVPANCEHRRPRRCSTSLTLLQQLMKISAALAISKSRSPASAATASAIELLAATWVCFGRETALMLAPRHASLAPLKAANFFVAASLFLIQTANSAWETRSCF